MPDFPFDFDNVVLWQPFAPHTHILSVPIDINLSTPTFPTFLSLLWIVMREGVAWGFQGECGAGGGKCAEVEVEESSEEKGVSEENPATERPGEGTLGAEHWVENTGWRNTG